MDILTLFGTCHHLGCQKLFGDGTTKFIWEVQRLLGIMTKYFGGDSKKSLEGSKQIYMGTMGQPKIEGVVGEEAKNKGHSGMANIQT